MAIAYRAGTSGSASGSSFSVSAPTGLTDGDGIAIVVDAASGLSWTSLAGFTLQAQGGGLYLFTKVASGEGASWTLGHVGSTSQAWSCGAWSGVNTSSPINVLGAVATAGSGSGVTAGGVTTGTANCMLIGAAIRGGVNTSITSPSGMTDRVNNGGSSSTDLCELAMPTAGASGSQTFGAVSGGGSVWGAVLFAWAPVPPNVAVAAAPFVAGHSALPTPVIADKVPAAPFTAGHSAMPAPVALLKVPAASATAGHSAAPPPALRWIVNVPAMTAGHPAIPPPLVGEFLRVSAVTMTAGHPSVPPPAFAWKLPVATMAAGHSTMPAPVVNLRLTAVTMRAGVPSLAPPSFAWKLVAATMRAGVPVMPPPTYVGASKIVVFAATMRAGVPVMPAPQLRGNNGPALDSQVVTDALSGRYGPVVITWAFERRTIQNQFLADVSPGMLGCTIDLDNARATVRTATFTIDPSLTTVDPIADHVAVIANLLVHYPGNPPFTLPIECGLFALNVPSVAYTSGAEIVWTIAASDLSIHLVQSTTTDIYTVAAGTNYVTAINTILSPFGFQAASITPTASTLSVAQTWPAGTPWLTIINKLLADLNYYALWFDRSGVPTSRLMIDNSQRQPDVVYTDDDWLIADVQETTDTTRFANQIIARVNNPGVAPLSSVATNADPASPTSTVSLGRTISQSITATAPDQATLDAIAQQALRLAAGAYRTAVINTQIDPRRDAHEVYSLTDTVATYDASAWLAETWKLDIDKPTMQHTATAVLPVNIS